MVTRVFVDADVLFSRTLRDWLFLTKLESGGGMYTVSTSLDVIAEATARYRDRNPTAPGRVIVEMFERISANIDERVDEYTVDGTFEGADAGDAHVDAAVRACGAGVLLTVDGGWHKMPEEQLDALPYEPLHPDEFFCIVEASAPSLMEKVIVKQMTYWFRRSGAADLPAALRAAGCKEFAERVRLRVVDMDCSFLTVRPDT
ncbi:hypothetical protein GCM10009630_39380 [Kribbella jejuensis]|uniref:PIN domain-containing protein n=1 Tax=Kribbella jejuensis TaxID=236068 RepID=A0A542ERS9_9ACTN|nr:PIN domain-containing protein [Kribbella jejuensis]TQJ17934.1 hypothetical protein FB475_2064 [Kribbella jejuensis]